MRLTARQLRTAELRLEVAIALIGLIDHELEHLDDRRTVVADVVARWRASSPRARARFRRAGPFSPLTLFAWDYVDRVEAANPDAPTEEYETALHRTWTEHVRLLRATTDCQPVRRPRRDRSPRSRLEA